MSDISISDARENLSGAVSDSRKDQLRISGVIDLLAQNPLPPKALKLSGRDGYRIRVGNYRIIYTFNNRVFKVLVI